MDINFRSSSNSKHQIVEESGNDRNIDIFWDEQLLEMQNTTTVSKNQHQLPLARIKRIIKSKGVKMVSSDTPILFSKACELFIMELTLRSWMRAEQVKRRTIQRCDIAMAVRRNQILYFLLDIVPFGHYCYKGDDDDAEKNNGADVSSAVESPNLPIRNSLGN